MQWFIHGHMVHLYECKVHFKKGCGFCSSSIQDMLSCTVLVYTALYNMQIFLPDYYKNATSTLACDLKYRPCAAKY